MDVQEEKKKHSGRGWKLAVLLTLGILLTAAAVTLTLDSRHVRFLLVDAAEITVPYGVPYQEPGCGAVSVGRLFGVDKHPLKVRLEGRVDPFTLGTYELTYSTRLFLQTYRTTRTVHVVDLTPPVITLHTVENYEPSWITGYQEEGYEAWDDHDGDVTARVEREDQGDRIVYRVADEAGNVAEAVREPAFVIGEPRLQLKGEESMTISARISFEDPGFTAADSQGHDLSDYVEVTGGVTPYMAGTYEIVYSISNNAGEVISATRTVVVEPVEPPATVQPDEYTIYLTFDDGPGPYTAQLLDLLKAYNVKATFFVTCLNSKYADMVGRAYEEGHTIGVHSATHDYYEIYASEQAFFDDFNRAEAMIYEQTGSYTKLFRFPGGSSNTVSRFNPGIMSRLAQSMNNMGYQYYDWNVSSGDAGETTNTNTVVENIINGCTGRKASVVLQHDIKDYSVAAVEQVILWGMQNGYTFRALDLSSPTAHHRIAN